MTDIERKRGDTYPIEILVVDDAGAVVNITGATFLFTVDPEKDPATSTNNKFQLSGVITNAAGGAVEFRPSAANVNLLGTFYHDIQMTDSGGFISTLNKGKFKLVQDITK